MSQKNTQGLTNHKTRANALERIDALETSYRALGLSIRESLKKIIERVELNEKILEAVTEILGQDIIESKTKELHVSRLEAQVAEVKTAVDKAAGEGRVLPLEAVQADNCLVVTEARNANGVVMHPSRIYNDISEYNEEPQKLLVGKKVGDVVELNDKSTVKVLEIWCQNLAPPTAETTAEEPKTE